MTDVCNASAWGKTDKRFEVINGKAVYAVTRQFFTRFIAKFPLIFSEACLGIQGILKTNLECSNTLPCPELLGAYEVTSDRNFHASGVHCN